MKKLTFYEQVGVVIPGAVMLFGVIYYFPGLKELIAKDGFSVGGLGVFVLLSYAAGHVVAAAGNVIESVLWFPFGGMPTTWVVRENQTLLSSSQVARLEQDVKTRLHLSVAAISVIKQKEWFPIGRQIYSDVMKRGKTARIDMFNANYGLNRGLCAATLALAALAALKNDIPAALGLLAIGAAYLYRTYRFGVHYARELYMLFLSADAPPKAKKAAAKIAAN